MKKFVLIAVSLLSSSVFAGTKSISTDDVYFEVIQNHEKVDIKWVTKAEFSNSYFVVERSKDGKTYEEVVRMQCSGSSNYMEYFDTDYTPAEGVSYYRLKQVTETNEEQVFSNATINYIKTEPVVSSDISITQNPANSQELNLLLKGFEGKEVLVVLRDQKGNEYFSKVYLNAMPQYIAALDPEQNLPKGEYIVTASANNKIYSKTIRVR